MGRWTYYSPLWIGALLIFSLNDAIRRGVAAYPDWQQWLIVVGAAIAGGLHCQILMLGTQGAFAQVLPVPGGRSIRGPAATMAGWLLALWFVLGIATVLLLMEGITTAAITVGSVTAATLIGAVLIYVWNLPAAVEDFRARRLE